jgi:transcriptional regulator with XRE-family HTH domain
MAKACKDLRNKVRSNPERAARVKTRRQAIEDALALAEIRERRELTQTDIAQVLEMSQANVSRIERQQNLYLSTLAEYVEALGGELKISAVFADEEVEIGVGRELSTSALRLKRSYPHRALGAIQSPE